jgi:hypothetical protein
MQRTTLGCPNNEKTPRAYVVGNDGTSHEVPFPNLSDNAGLGGGAGAKSTIKDLLLMYQSLLFAYGHQSQSSSDTTPASPFKHLRTIFSTHIENDVAYCLGLYRTRLPGNLCIGSMNSLLIGPSRMPSIGTDSQGLDVYHHTANISSFTASAFLIPSSKSAVVVITNSLPMMDPTDFVGQSILSLLQGEQVPADLSKLSERACAASLSSHQVLASQLANRKTAQSPRFPLAA